MPAKFVKKTTIAKINACKIFKKSSKNIAKISVRENWRP